MSMYDLDDAPNWRGRDVIDQNGHPVGVITDLFVDEATGRSVDVSALVSRRIPDTSGWSDSPHE